MSIVSILEAYKIKFDVGCFKHSKRHKVMIIYTRLNEIGVFKAVVSKNQVYTRTFCWFKTNVKFNKIRKMPLTTYLPNVIQKPIACIPSIK